jgi:hypothetical protein
VEGRLLQFQAEVAVNIDIQRRLAIAELLTQPDPPEMRRGNRICLPGKPERFDLVPRLSAVFVQAKLLALHERRDTQRAA